MTPRPSFALARPGCASDADAAPDAWAEWAARIDADRAAAARDAAGPVVDRRDLLPGAAHANGGDTS